MQEAPNLKKKDEQQERGNYDSAVDVAPHIERNLWVYDVWGCEVW